MPVYKINSPSGEVIEVEAPAGASDAQLISLAQQKAQAAKPVEPTTGQVLLASIPGRLLKGMKDPIDAGAQMLPRALSTLASGFGHFPNAASEWLDSEAKRVDAGIADSEKEYQAARWAAGQSGFDGARLTGNIAGPASVAMATRLPTAATALGRIVSGAAAGSVGGLLQPVTSQGEGEPSFAAQKTGQALIGGASGAVLGPLLGKAADLAAPRIKALAAKFTEPGKLQAAADAEAGRAVEQVIKDANIDASGIPPQMLADLRTKVVESLRQGQKLDPAAQLRKLDFDAQGVPALRGQITRDPRQYSGELNLRGVEGVGEPIQNLLSSQNQKITGDLAKFGGPKAAERFQAGELFSQALKKLDDRLGSDVSRAYQNARASSAKDWEVPMPGFASDVANAVETFGIGGERNAIPSAIANRLKSFGVINDPAMTQRRVFNYEEADKLLKQINAHDDGGNASLSALRSAVKRAITQAGTEGDPFKVPRQMAADRFALLDAIPALEAVSQGRIAPDDFVQKFIVNGKTKDLQKLADVLPTEAKEEAKRQIAKVIYDGAFKGNATGDKLASPGGLQKAMKDIGSEKLKVFFSAKEIEELNRLTRVTSYANTEPAWGTVARGGNPGGTLFSSLARSTGAPGIGMALPLVGTLQQARRAAAALNTTVPASANLTPADMQLMQGLLGTASMGSGSGSVRGFGLLSESH